LQMLYQAQQRHTAAFQQAIARVNPAHLNLLQNSSTKLSPAT